MAVSLSQEELPYQTLLSVLTLPLQQRGARDITILVTHGLFTGDLWRKLWSLGGYNASPVLIRFHSHQSGPPET
jgi:hypothetical protein